MARTNRSKYTEDWLPVQGINNGMILLPGQMKVCGVKITPRNIFILDEDSQQNILIALKNFYNQLDFEFWLVVADRPVDISIYMSQLQLLYNNTQNPAIRKLINEDMEYFLLFKEKNLEILQKKVRLMINGLASCGLSSSQTSNEDMRIILDNFLNGGSTTEFGTVMSS